MNVCCDVSRTIGNVISLYLTVLCKLSYDNVLLPICNTRQCRYNVIIFLQDTHKRHSITRPLWRDMGCLWGFKSDLCFVLSLECIMQYDISLRRVLMAHDCILSLYATSEKKEFNSILWRFLRGNGRASPGNIQCGAVIKQQIFFTQFSHRSCHSSSVRAWYGVSFVFLSPDLYSSASITAVIYAVSRYIGSRYNGTHQYTPICVCMCACVSVFVCLCVLSVFRWKVSLIWAGKWCKSLLLCNHSKIMMSWIVTGHREEQQ